MPNCCVCKTTKDVAEFTPSELRANSPRCRPCAKDRSAKYVAANREDVYRRNREYYKNNTARVIETSRLWYEKNRDDILAAKKKYHADNKEEINRKRRAEKGKLTFTRWKYRLKKKFGISPQEYLRILGSQENVCGICGATSPGGRNNNFVVDHCHATGVVRGLLCQRCNIGLGQFLDNTLTLMKAISYLEKQTTITKESQCQQN